MTRIEIIGKIVRLMTVIIKKLDFSTDRIDWHIEVFDGFLRVNHFFILSPSVSISVILRFIIYWASSYMTPIQTYNAMEV